MIKSTKRIVFFLLFLQSLNAQFLFQKANPDEILQIQNSMLIDYSEQLVQAGLFADVNVARELAKKTEWTEERQDPAKEFFYYYLTSEDSSSKYGYLVYWIEKQVAYLDSIYLEEAYRGQGLGTQILQEYERSLKERNIETSKLYVFAHNQRAFGLYQKMGYELETTYYQEDKLIGHHLIKNLNL
jgi:ribosomal protein S18 acetylase RimI-like enzyme